MSANLMLVATRFLQLLLCVMLLIQVSPVAPCFLDEALSEDASESISKAAASNSTASHIYCDEDAASPSLSQVRVCISQPAARAHSLTQYPPRIDLPAMVVHPHHAGTSARCLNADGLDRAPPFDLLTARVLPLLL